MRAVRSEARFPEKAAGEKDGHYESFYLKLTDPAGGRGAWIRHTVHKRPGEQITCALWFVLFDASAAGPRATKRQFGPDQLDAPAGSYIRVGDAVLGDGRATGSVSTDALTASWDLTFSDSHEPFHHLPRDFLYNAPLPKTKFLSPYPNAVYNGTLEVGGESIDVRDWTMVSRVTTLPARRNSSSSSARSRAGRSSGRPEARNCRVVRSSVTTPTETTEERRPACRRSRERTRASSSPTSKGFVM